MKKIINTKNAPEAIGPYSQGIIGEASQTIYVSGQLPIDPKTSEMPNDIKDQTRQSLKNLQAILKEAGASMESVVKTTVYLKDMNEFSQMNEVYLEFFDKSYPARVAIEVARLPKDAKVEIDAIALKE